MEFALVVAAALVAIGCSCGVFFAAGYFTVIFFEREYHARLKVAAFNAMQEGHKRGIEEAEKLKAYNEGPIPHDPQERADTKAWAEGLEGIYPADSALREEAKRAREARE